MPATIAVKRGASPRQREMALRLLAGLSEGERELLACLLRTHAAVAAARDMIEERGFPRRLYHALYVPPPGVTP